MKIMPSNLDDFNDVQKIGDEFYFKKDADFKTTEDVDNRLPIPTDYSTTQEAVKFLKIHKVEQTPHSTSKDGSSEAVHNTESDANKNEIDSYVPHTENVFEDNSLRDVRSTADYGTMQRKLATVTPTATAFSSIRPQQNVPISTETAPTKTIDTVSQTWENEILRENPNIFDALEIADKNDIIRGTTTLNSNDVIANNEIEPIENYDRYLENISESSIRIPMELDKIVISKNDGLVVKVEDNASIGHTTTTTTTTQRSVIHNDRKWISEEDEYSSYEDYAVEVHGSMVRRKNKIRVHTSYQKTAIRQPLLQQGFIASPGYPKFYIGESNCSWRITVPHGQKIRLTILDINLRCK